MAQLVFGGILAVIMLGLYAYSISAAINLAQRCGDINNCGTQLSGNLSLVFNVVGGLISATVVGVLGSTNRGNFPAINSLKNDLKNKNAPSIITSVPAYMPSLFILFWIICGVVILMFGFLTYANDPVPALSAQAKAWLGTAIGAVYAYLGITPDPPENGDSPQNNNLPPTS